MKKNSIFLITIVCFFSSFCLASKVPVWGPSDPPSWWAEKCDYYAYGYWDKTIYWIPGNFPQYPPNDHPRNWASNYLENTDFKVNGSGDTITITLKNIENTDYVKEICIYLWGFSDLQIQPPAKEPWQQSLDIGGQKFIGNSKGVGTIRKTNPNDQSNWPYCWSYRLEGVIDHQPGCVELSIRMPDWRTIQEIYAGENCIPEPASVLLLGIGGLFLKRRS